ncbi:rRNA cytosine-C5-methyltransferase [Coprobacter sp. LH1063]|uniref:rRNA cytosine-C5-methyltransferase n=1 Tax=Coprobacter tertius TaxID=2944915 RepID=A0ABT1MK10_9BACT|nr:rRNA cytosine-C5-methyltransferase [Coprobacter tertius]MCP9612965.1 rRNA cytosine-C5-methyltransferase [Coprobacter tertius]
MITLPDEFIVRNRRLLGEKEYNLFEAALQKTPPVSIRVNKRKNGSRFFGQNIVPWEENAFYLEERPSFTFDPLFHAGTYYVQEASSMFLGQILEQYVKKPVRYLDLCAAPGGKSTQAIDILSKDSLIICNEILRSRANILTENVIKWGQPNCIVTNNNVSDFSYLHHYFDVILTDVPCSGEGMFRKDNGAITEWSLANVNRCSSRQKEILSSTWDLLRPGGLFIYSTCTYNTEENEDTIIWLHENYGAEVLPVITKQSWGIKPALKGNFPVYRFMPHATKGEGFFIAVLQKPDSESCTHRETLISAALKKNKKKKNNGQRQTSDNGLYHYISEADNFVFENNEERSFAFPKVYANDLILLSDRLNLLHAGIPLTVSKGKDKVPEHALALSSYINRKNFPTVEIDISTAISYLRRETITIPEGYPKGYLLVIFKDTPLGWIKNIGNRTNNLYPQEWRIRSSHSPENTEHFL